MNVVRQLWHKLWTLFLSGFFALLPIALTIALFTFVFKLVHSWFSPIYYIEPAYLKKIPGSQVLVVIVFILLVGILIQYFFFGPFIHALERVFSRVPLMRLVYGGIKQLVHALTVQDELSFQRVVIIPFPHEKTYSLGFVTSVLSSSIVDLGDQKFYNVFVPTTPNPTTGFLVQVAEKDIKSVNLTRQEAMSLIISGGLIRPDRFL